MLTTAGKQHTMWCASTYPSKPGCYVYLQELIFTARRVAGKEAHELGLVDHCVEAGQAMARALELARDISQVPCWSISGWREEGHIGKQHGHGTVCFP